MKVAIDQILNRTKMRLLLTQTTHADAYLEKLINEAATHHIGGLDNFVVSCETLDIDCLKARLPINAVDLICYSFPDATGCSGCCIDCMNPHNPNATCSCPNWFVADRNILTEFCGSGVSAGLSSNFFDVQNGYIVFPSSVTQPTVKVWYRGLNIDEDGIAILDESWERGLSAYAAWQYAIAHFKSYASEQRKLWQMEWTAQRERIRGLALQRDAILHKPEVSAIARAILMNPMVMTNRNG